MIRPLTSVFPSLPLLDPSVSALNTRNMSVSPICSSNTLKENMQNQVMYLCDTTFSISPSAFSALPFPIDIARPSNPFSFLSKPFSAFPDDFTGVSMLRGVATWLKIQIPDNHITEETFQHTPIKQWNQRYENLCTGISFTIGEVTAWPWACEPYTHKKTSTTILMLSLLWQGSMHVTCALDMDPPSKFLFIEVISN